MSSPRPTASPWPEGGLQIPTGIANPVLIAIGVTVVMTILATRRRFGRYVYAIGGNPEAAELGGINTRRIIMMTFVLMGILAAVSARDLDRPPRVGGRRPRGRGGAGGHRRGGHRRDVVRRRHRDDPRRGLRRRPHAVAPVGHGPPEGRRPDPGHHRRHRARDGGRSRHRPPAPSWEALMALADPGRLSP